MSRYTIEIKNKRYSIDVEEVDANHFRVVLDHQTYDVNFTSVEDLVLSSSQPERPTPIPKLVKPDMAERAPHVPLPVHPPVTVKKARADLTAPMPGTILNILVKPGDSVKRGQTILILEAMKMQNAVKSPQDGVIKQVVAESGKAVHHGDVLVRFEETAA